MTTLTKAQQFIADIEVRGIVLDEEFAWDDIEDAVNWGHMCGVDGYLHKYTVYIDSSIVMLFAKSPLKYKNRIRAANIFASGRD